MAVHVRCKSWCISLQKTTKSEFSEEREPQRIISKIYISNFTLGSTFSFEKQTKWLLKKDRKIRR